MSYDVAIFVPNSNRRWSIAHRTDSEMKIHISFIGRIRDESAQQQNSCEDQCFSLPQTIAALTPKNSWMSFAHSGMLPRDLMADRTHDAHVHLSFVWEFRGGSKPQESEKEGLHERARRSSADYKRHAELKQLVLSSRMLSVPVAAERSKRQTAKLKQFMQ